ncbi:MAG: 16S rRNA (cytidine(1402)-2'-O)-methyltransferase [Anaerolineales bacterium]|nr:16S rRNA (cytidine(1402)-2'-O)-methyltransferase [Anaerolineales bacterium]
MSTLYLVSTPIGNLEDITQRALRILDEVALIAAEDTRHTGRLLKHFEIATPLRSFHEHNKSSRLPELLEALTAGDLALVSDAGTPLVNDPGHELVRAALSAGHQVSPIPGPSAPLAALTASGLPADAFLYLGYLPRRRSGRKNALMAIADLPYTLIFLETPHRLLSALEDIEETLGNREMAVARELTKMHEEIFRGPVSAAQRRFAETGPKGEITLVVAGHPGDPGSAWDEERLRGELRKRMDEGASASQLAKTLAKDSGWTRSEVYNLILAAQKDAGRVE